MALRVGAQQQYSLCQTERGAGAGNLDGEVGESLDEGRPRVCGEICRLETGVQQSGELGAVLGREHICIAHAVQCFKEMRVVQVVLHDDLEETL